MSLGTLGFQVGYRSSKITAVCRSMRNTHFWRILQSKQPRNKMLESVPDHGANRCKFTHETVKDWENLRRTKDFVKRLTRWAVF
jgi:hypothetical protein